MRKSENNSTAQRNKEKEKRIVIVTITEFTVVTLRYYLYISMVNL